VALTFEEQSYVRGMLRRLLDERFGKAFERFFQNLMCARYIDFIDVRTHGKLGDIGADGLSLHDGKLYACYAPEVPDAAAVRAKFNDDLTKAVAKRGDHFDTFVFVHNDLRGVHPELSILLGQARQEHPTLRFEQRGPQHLHRELCRLERDEIIAALRYTHLVDEYYQQRRDVTERDEVAEGINAYYRRIRPAYDDPGDVLWKLQEYVAGNARGRRDHERAVMVVLGYFFETCDIFEEPPTNWRTPAGREMVS
jgi:hypothetical protein